MRNYTLAPRKRTHLPNASTLGYGKYYAEPGDIVRFKDGGTAPVIGRVLGQITSCDQDGQDCTGWLAVATLGENLSFAFTRWIEPSEITECLPASQVAPFLSAFLSATIPDTIAALEANSQILAVAKDGYLWNGTSHQ